MCGLFCLIKKSPLNEKDINFCRQKTKELSHRGPDNYGEWQNKNIFFGHQRLSINDLSHKANQPFVKYNKVLIFNGEIYNFEKLKQDQRLLKYNFETSCDTEVLFYLLLEYGIEGLNKINGMFAFIFFDGKNVIISNDYFSEKTLYYYQNQDYFIISSELKNLIDLDTKNISKENLYSYLTFGHLINGNTFYKKIKKLNNSEVLNINDNIEVKKYSFFDIKRYYLQNKAYNLTPKKKDFDDLKNIITQNISLKNIGDVNKSLLLSGGLDSSTVYSILADVDKNIETITFLNPEEDYSDLDRLIKNKNILNKQIPSNKIELNPQKILVLFGQPHNSFTSLAIKEICNTLYLNSYKVALTGLGGDEIFLGYNKYYDYNKIKFKLKKIIKFGFKDIDLALLCKSKIFWNLIEDKEYQNWIVNTFVREKNLSSLENLFIDELNIFMPNSRCVTNDVASMSESIELRSCFLDIDILKWVLKFDLNKIHKLGRKKLLKNYYDEINKDQFQFNNKKSPFRVMPQLSSNLSSHCKEIFLNAFPNIKFDKNIRTRENINALEILSLFS